MKEIRDYFHKQIRTVESKIKAKDSPLDDASLSQVDVDCAYHLYIGPNRTVARLNDGIDDGYLCKVTLYSSARNCDNYYYDKAYDRATCIRNELVKASNIGENDFITDVAPATILPRSAPNNEKVFIFEINVNVSVVTCL